MHLERNGEVTLLVGKKRKAETKEETEICGFRQKKGEKLKIRGKRRANIKRREFMGRNGWVSNFIVSDESVMIAPFNKINAAILIEIIEGFYSYKRNVTNSELVWRFGEVY